MSPIEKPVSLPKPRPEAPPEVVKPAFAKRHAKLLRAIRLVLSAVVLGLLVFGAINYDLFTIPGDKGGKAFLGFSRGDTLIRARYRFWHPPRLGEVVFYRDPTSAEHVLVGRIAGMPGEKVKRVGPTMTVGDREPLAVGFDLGVGAKIKDGDVIPEGKYLILVDSDDFEYPDSRAHGYVAGEDIEYRLVMNLAQLWGSPKQSR